MTMPVAAKHWSIDVGFHRSPAEVVVDWHPFMGRKLCYELAAFRFRSKWRRTMGAPATPLGSRFRSYLLGDPAILNRFPGSALSGLSDYLAFFGKPAQCGRNTIQLRVPVCSS